MPTRQYSWAPLQRLIMTPMTMSILSPLTPAPHTTTRITTAPRKRFVSFRTPDSIHIYRMLS